MTLPTLDVNTSSITAGGFVQDSWSILDQVTVNVGFRYDAQFLYDATGARALSFPNEWSPRLGAIYDPTQSGHAKMFANYARYYESMPLDIADRALRRAPHRLVLSRRLRRRRHCGPGSLPRTEQSPGRRSPGRPEPRPVSYGAPEGIDPQIKPPSSDEIVLGGEYEIMKDARLGLSYTRRWLNYAVEDMSRDEGKTAFIGNPGYGIAADFPKAERSYDAATLYFSKMFSEGWLASASYTMSYLRGNYLGLYHAETDQLDPNVNSDFDLKSLLPNRTGPLPGDQTHRIKLFGAKDWVVAKENVILLGVALRAHSGGPTSYLGAHPLYGPDEAYILPRGSGPRLPWEYGADLKIGYRLQMAKDRTLEATIDIFNLFDFQAMTGVDQTYTNAYVLPVMGAKANADGTITNLKNADGSPFDPKTKNPNFGNPNQYQAPRTVRFGLRTTF